jgi:uncharacterized membrane protein
VISFVVIDGLLIYKLASKTNHVWAVVACSLVMAVVLFLLYRMGKSPERKRRGSERNGTDTTRST